MSPIALTIDNERYLHVGEAARRANVVPDYMSRLAAQPREPPRERFGKPGRSPATSEDGPGKNGRLWFSYELEKTTNSQLEPWRTPMKVILSALVALSVLAGVAAPASAFDAKGFYDQQDRQAN